MQISAIVPTYNRRELLLSTVRTLLRQEYSAAEYEIVVVVDGATDGSSEALRPLQSGERLRIVAQENRGLAAARNTGARHAHGELLVFLDDDMECVPQLLAEHARAHESRENGGIAGLGAIYVSPENPPNLAAEYFNRGLGAPYIRQRERPGDPWPENAWSFGNTSIRRAAFERAGGFDERFRMREDGELGVRLRAVGVRQQFVSSAVAYQWCAKSAAELVSDAASFAEADLLFFRTHPGEMPHDFLPAMRREGEWKRQLRRRMLAHPRLADLALAPVCALGEALPGITPLREAAVRALMVRCGLRWFHRLAELSGHSAEDWLRGNPA